MTSRQNRAQFCAPAYLRRPAPQTSQPNTPTVQPRWQWLLSYLRRVGGSWRINTEAMDSNIWEVWAENGWKFRLGIWIPSALAILILRSSRLARKALVQAQTRFTPGLYTDLFEKYQPDLVIASTAGWRLDRYLLREAHQRGIPTMAAIVGWDNSVQLHHPRRADGLRHLLVELQKDELVLGSDWDPERVHIGGIPSYDGYFRKTWQMSREDYFRLHGLDEKRKLISYACSFVHFAPNYPNVEALAKLVSPDSLSEPSQLLIRLHPSHFQDKPRFCRRTRADLLPSNSSIRTSTSSTRWPWAARSATTAAKTWTKKPP
jgi:hypothetical protein